MRPTRRTGAWGKSRACISVAAVISLAACQAGPALFGAPGVQRAGDLEFGAHADVKAGRPDTLDVRVAVVNRGTQPVVASWGGCAMRIRLYPPRPAVRPVWDSHGSPAGSGGRTICPAILREQRIEAGDSLPPNLFRFRFSPPQVLFGDTLPPGSYRVLVGVEIGRRRRWLGAGTVHLPPLQAAPPPRDAID